MSTDMQVWDLQGRFAETDDEWDEHDEEEMRDQWPEDCAYGGMYNPGSEYCDFVCPIGPCMTLDQYGAMMDEDARYQIYLDRIESAGWRGKLWRAWYWLGDIRLRLPQSPVKKCEICGRRYWGGKKYTLDPTCSITCFDQAIPF